ncbi:MAG: Ig-like domain-containing protein [Firmicutes bacterium]|nr:Ig-like domain-containing protein [Bacillota bacterium]MBQ6663102.1 Ig-like domain-containing protein [Bacillota bacterium]MCR4711694.1 Ig-like domain-containing protein [Clostridia bacterium]
MRKTITRLCLIVVLIVLFTGSAFADSLEIVEQYPTDGQKNTSVENLSVKLTFNNPVSSEANRDANAACFKLTDTEGTELPIKVYYSPKNEKQILVLYDTSTMENNKSLVKGDMTYTLSISGDFKDDNGNTLGSDRTVSFSTLNQAFNTRIYLIMMAVMMVAMIGISSRQARKQVDKDEAADLAAQRDAAFNPYKEAKRTGKPVEEIIAQHEKEVAKREARAAKLAAKLGNDEEEEEEEEIPSGNHRVKGPRPIAAAGGKYITGRAALAEAQRAEEERLARRRANAKKKRR